MKNLLLIVVAGNILAGFAADAHERITRRREWNCAPFAPETYRKAPRTYAAAAEKAVSFFAEHPTVTSLAEKGVPDTDYAYNCYPAKMYSAIIRFAIRAAERYPERTAFMMRAAHGAADYLISISQPTNAPLAHFPPTYLKTSKAAGAAVKYFGQNMLIYPADVGLAFLRLECATGETKYLAAAERIGRTYLKLQGKDGTWPLKVWEKDGSPVAENRYIPVEALDFLEALEARTGDPVWRRAADRAFAFIENGPMKTDNWEGQFEDTTLQKPYDNLCDHGAGMTAMYLLKRFPGNPERLAQAKKLLTFIEEQFVYWGRPDATKRGGTQSPEREGKPNDWLDSTKWHFPGSGEQYGWDVPVDAHTSTVALLYLAMYRATGDGTYLAKGRALMDSVVCMQLDNGVIVTQWVDIPGNDDYWLNCFERSIEALCVFADADAKPVRSFGPLLPSAQPAETEYIWPEGKMPDAQPHQIAAKSQVAGAPGFRPDDWRRPFLEWYAPTADAKKDVCVIMVSGGGFGACCDAFRLQPAIDRYVKFGVTVANLTYRTPLPKGLPMHQCAWEDLQRAVRVVRSQAAKRGYSPEKIGAQGISAGSKAILLVATSSQTPAYAPVDATDEVPCHLNFAVPIAPAYVLTDGDGVPNVRAGESVDVKIVDALTFDAKTCPMCFIQGGADAYSPNGSVAVYAELRKRKIPAELHLYPDRPHDVLGDLNRTERPEGHDRWFGRVTEFLVQMGFFGPLAPEEKLEDRFGRGDGTVRAGSSTVAKERQSVWPEGRMPYATTNPALPFIEWNIPRYPTTKAIQIVYSGGCYTGNTPYGFEVAPICHYLNDKGMTVVTLRYRSPRPTPETGLAKHTPAWADLQRAVRLVRSQAATRGLDPNRIGIMGSSAGGHLTLMGATTSVAPAYWNLGDEVDAFPCNVQWAIAIYPAYVLTDGLDGCNATRGLGDDVRLAREFAFDLKTCPILFIHGDADGYSPMGSVRVWEQLRRMGIQGELHTLATRGHCFQAKASPGTGSYTWMDRIWEFMNHRGVNRFDNVAKLEMEKDMKVRFPSRVVHP